MLGLRLLGAGLLTAFAFLNCGGSSTSNSSGATEGGASVGASSDGMECAGAAPDGGCGGAGGEAVLEPYARLRTACSLSVRVNRRGAPVCIDSHIQ